MATWKSIMVAVALFVITVAVAFGAFQIADAAQDSAATVDKTVENETLTQYYDNYQLVNKSTEEFTAGFNNTATVYNSSGVELTDGTDYDWNATDGAITFYDTDNTTAGENATITYTYFENANVVKKIAGPLKPMVEGIGRFPLMVAGLGLAVLFFSFVAILLRSTSNLGSKGPGSRR